jgi:hypothetical protein
VATLDNRLCGVAVLPGNPARGAQNAGYPVALSHGILFSSCSVILLSMRVLLRGGRGCRARCRAAVGVTCADSIYDCAVLSGRRAW